jgi:hypothetical protein
MIKLKEYYQSMYGKLNEAVDDEQMIKYKDEDGESKEMSAKAAKRMAKDHPAKIEYDKQKGGDSGGAKKGVNIFDKPDEKPKDEPKSEPKGGDSESEDLKKVQSVKDIDDIDRLKSDLDFDQRFDDIKDEDSGYKDAYGDEMTIDDIDFKIKMINAGEDPYDFLDPFEDEDALADAWKEATAKAMASKKESIKGSLRRIKEQWISENM